MKFRPKKFVMYRYGELYKAYINCLPQSRWELVYEKEDEVVLNNKHTSIAITRQDFEKHWIRTESEET